MKRLKGGLPSSGSEEEVLGQILEDALFAKREPRMIAPTAEEKVMLHLIRFARYQDQWEVPFAVTQTGISKATKILRNNIPRTMRKLIERGYVIKKSAHVKGSIKRRQVYFLSAEGLAKAKAMEECLQELPVLLKTPEGATEEVELKDIPEHVSEDLSTLNVVLNITEDGVFDSETAQAEAPSGDEESVSPSANIPAQKHFFGRKAEIDAVSKWLRSDAAKFLVLRGIAGSGKTAFAASIVGLMGKKMSVFWFNFHEWDSIGNVLSSLSKFLVQRGRKELRDYLGETKNIDMNEVAELLETQLRETDALLVFDDFHKANDHILPFFLALRESLERIDGVKVIVMGRHIKPFYDSRDIAIKKVVAEMRLGGLEQEAAKHLLDMRDIRGIDRIYELTEGHPLFLELIETPDDLKRDSSLKRYLYEQIYSKLTEDERSALKFLSVFRYPVPLELLLLDASVSFDTLKRLEDLSLIYEVLPGRYHTHELVKEFSYGVLVPKVKQQYHGMAAQHYLKGGDGYACIEAQYHLLRAGEHERAAALAVERGTDLMGEAYIEGFMEILREFDSRNTSPENLLSITVLKANILTVQARLDEALACLDEARSLNEKVQSRVKEAEIHLRMGDVYERKSMEEGENPPEQDTRPSKAVDRPADEEAARGVEMVKKKQSSWDDAIEHCRKSLEILESMGLELAVAKGHTYLGQIYAEKGEKGEKGEDKSEYEKYIELRKKRKKSYIEK